MFGFRLLRETEIALQKQLTDVRIATLETELAAAKAIAAKWEVLVDKERERIDAERERADRISDSLLMERGLPATSTTVLSEQRAQESAADAKRTKQMTELLEIYGETEHELLEDGAEPLPDEIAETLK